MILNVTPTHRYRVSIDHVFAGVIEPAFTGNSFVFVPNTDTYGFDSHSLKEIASHIDDLNAKHVLPYPICLNP